MPGCRSPAWPFSPGSTYSLRLGRYVCLCRGFPAALCGLPLSEMVRHGALCAATRCACRQLLLTLPYCYQRSDRYLPATTRMSPPRETVKVFLSGCLTCAWTACKAFPTFSLRYLFSAFLMPRVCDFPIDFQIFGVIKKVGKSPQTLAYQGLAGLGGDWVVADI